MASVTQVRRLLDLLERLRSDEAYNARQLAEQLGVSRRTLFRDLRSLEKLGVRAEYDERRQRYVVSMSEELANTAEITPAELQSLMSLGERIDDTPTSANPEALAKRLGFHATSTDQTAPSNVAWGKIIEAIQTHQVVRVGVDRALRDFEPLRMFFAIGRWFMLIRERSQGTVSLRSAAEIESVELLDETFTPPEDDELDRLTQQAWQSDVETPDGGEVIIEFEAGAAQSIATQNHFPSQDLEWLDGGGVVLRTTMVDPQLVTPWVLAYGSSATVVSPESLRTTIAQEASRLANRYLDNA